MLGQKTINPGPLATCPTRTVRKSRTGYPLLCAPVRRPITSIYERPDDDERYESGNEEDDSYDEHTKQTPRLITSKRINLQNYMESTEIYYNDYGTEDFQVPSQPNQKHILFDTHHTETEKSITFVKQLPEKRLYYGKFRDNVERVSEVASRKLTTYWDEDNKLEYFKKSTRQGSISRQRWKDTQKKPERPGAKALLKKTPVKMELQSPRSFLMLDQDDLDQFFRDTGFHLNWRKKPVQ